MPASSLSPDLGALEWTSEGELAAAPRLRLMQSLLKAESQPAVQSELIRASVTAVQDRGHSVAPQLLP